MKEFRKIACVLFIPGLFMMVFLAVMTVKITEFVEEFWEFFIEIIQEELNK